MSDYKETLSCSYSCKPAPATTSYTDIPSEYSWLFAIAIAIIIYFARDYPQWKVERERLHKLKQQGADNNNSSPLDNTFTTTTEQEPFSQQQESMISARWIPYLPLAVVLVAFKAVWESLRHLVLRSILAAEESGPYLKSSVKKAAHWTVYHGPAFVHSKILEPSHRLAVVLWDSIALAIEHTVAPLIVRSYNFIKDPALNTLAWILRAARFMLGVTEWLFIQCLFNPAQAIWNRFSVLGLALAHAAETTLYGLAKDARDLGYLIAKGATWIWARILLSRTHLHALGAKLGELTDLVVTHVTEVVLPWCTLRILELTDFTFKHLTESLPRILQRVYTLSTETLPKVAEKVTDVLRPVGAAMVDGIHFIQSHPTFTSLVEAVSLKVKESFLIALERLESVNWLMLLEETLQTLFQLAIEYAYYLVLVVIDMIVPYYLLATFTVEMAMTTYRHAKDPTEVITFVRHHSAAIRQSAGRSYRVFISTAYDDFRVAIEIARPIVSWVVNILVWIARHLWQLASLTWAIVNTNAAVTMVWVHLNIAVPTKNVWSTKVMPGFLAAQMVVREQSPVISAAIWSVALKMTDVTQSVLIMVTQVLIKMMDLLGAVGGRVEEQWKNVEPQVEEFKKQTGEAMDLVVQALNDRIVDYTKAERSANE